jgi:hypothetical protein
MKLKHCSIRNLCVSQLIKLSCVQCESTPSNVTCHTAPCGSRKFALKHAMKQLCAKTHAHHELTATPKQPGGHACAAAIPCTYTQPQQRTNAQAACN